MKFSTIAILITVTTAAVIIGPSCNIGSNGIGAVHSVSVLTNSPVFTAILDRIRITRIRRQLKQSQLRCAIGFASLDSNECRQLLKFYCHYAARRQ